MITIHTWKEAPEHYKALSDHGGDEDFVIVGAGRGNLDEIMEIRAAFDQVIERLDVYDHGEGTIHTIESEDGIDSELVYIIAHS